MKLILEYVKANKKILLLMLWFHLIFLVVLYLSNLPLLEVSYAILLCGFSVFLYVIIDAYRFIKHHNQLDHQKSCVQFSLEELPMAKGLIEKDYQALVKSLHDSYKELLLDTDQEKSDMMNYYTLWVHQIKTPIAAMRILLQSKEDASKTALENELFKIEQYVEMVLSYLRLGSETTDYQIQRYQINDIVKQAVRKYAKLFVHKKITLEYQEIDEIVLTDEKWLLFVIEQILSNALKYTRSGKISIYQKPGCVLVIEDTGIGISPEDVPRVFEKGYTGYHGRSDKKSTGLGLYLCKMIINKLGHNINLSSIEGKGTIVELDLSTVDIVHE